MIAMMVAAAIFPQRIPYPVTKVADPTVKVVDLKKDMTRAIRNSFQEKIKQMMATAAAADRVNGKMILVMICRVL